MGDAEVPPPSGTATVTGSMTKQPSERKNITPGAHKRDFRFLAKKMAGFISEVETY